MKIIHRPARREDLPECLAVFEESVADLRARHNRAAPVQVIPPERRLLFYEHALATGIFHVAEADGRIAAFACAIVRDHLWFLSGFWTRPGMQGQGLGMPALRSVWNAGKAAGATHFYVWSSIDEQAIAAYMKMGMLPGCQILGFEGAPSLPDESPAGWEVARLNKSFAMALDKTVLGTPRELDHDFMVRIGWTPRQVLHQGKPVGYFYINGEYLAPVAWTQPAHASSVLTMACRDALNTTSRVSLPIPGMNHDAIRFALQAGLRLGSYAHLLLSAPFGHLDQYIPSGPALF